MRKSEDRVLVTHTGSLPRPPELTALYARRAQGEAIDAGHLLALGRQATRDVVAKQLAVGIDVDNNGEQEREGFFLYVQHRMSGFGGRWDQRERQDVTRYPEFQRQLQTTTGTKVAVSNFQPPKAVGPVSYLDVATVACECESFRQAMNCQTESFVEPFVTTPSPGIIATAMRNEYYESETAYIDALADALQTEYATIVANGFILQLDCPDLALERHISYQDRSLSDFLEFVETVVCAINRALSDIPKNRVRLHVCWGNYEGPHDCDMALANILPVLLQARVGALVLPFANPRHAHEFRCFERHRLGDEQLLVAGVVDSLTNFVEHPEVIADRIERVARTIGDPTRVLAGTDCGFDTSAGMGRVTEDVVWAKLRSLRDGARLASERLL